MARNSICGVGVAYECHIGGDTCMFLILSLPIFPCISFSPSQHVNHNSPLCISSHNVGLKIDLENLSDAMEASAIGFQNNHIQVYSNSWGPSDYYGFIVDGPGRLARGAILTGVTEVG